MKPVSLLVLGHSRKFHVIFLVFWPPGVRVYLVSETVNLLFGELEGLIANFCSGRLSLVSLKLQQASAYYLVFGKFSEKVGFGKIWTGFYGWELGFLKIWLSGFSKFQIWVFRFCTKKIPAASCSWGKIQPPKVMTMKKTRISAIVKS